MAYYIDRYRQTRYYAVYTAAGELVAVVVYRKGAEEIVRRLRGGV